MIGQIISHYRIIEKLGEGGMGVVYKAHDTKLDRTVALKFLPQYISQNSDEKTRFMHEARALSSLNHPHIATIYSIEEYCNQTFIAMEYLDGGTLKQKVKAKQLSIQEVVDYAIQIAEGLSYAHQKNIIHRDIKTDNIMISEAGLLKITDFGLSKLQGATKVTKAGSTVGTAGYMSPEQARGEEVDLRSDIWSLGVVMYEMLTGQVPFKGEFEAAVLYSVINEPPKSITDFRSDVPKELLQIIEKALQKDRNKRYQSVDETLGDLQILKISIVSRGVIKRKESIFRFRAKTKKILLISVFIFVIGICIIIFWLNRTQEHAKFGLRGDEITIAVLPFKNIGASAIDTLMKGFAEDIRRELSEQPRLIVISSSSSISFNWSPDSCKIISSKLGAQFLLSCSFQSINDNINFSCAIYNSSAKRESGHRSYHKPRNQLLQIRELVVRNVLDTLRLHDDNRRFYSTSPQAYEFYLYGLYHANLLTRDDNNIAIENFSKAIQIDSTYIIPKIALARTQIEKYREGWATSETLLIDAEIKCQNVLEVDLGNSDAYAILGVVKNLQGNPKEAIELLNKSLDLNSNNIVALQSLGFIYLFQVGQPSSGRPLLLKIERMDPLDWLYPLNLGVGYAQMGNLPEALKSFQRAMGLNPNHEWPVYSAGYTLEKLGMYEMAKECYSNAIKINPMNVKSHVALIYILIKLAEINKADSVIDVGLKYLPDDIELIYLSGVVSNLGGRQTEAKILYQKGLRLLGKKIYKNPKISDSYAYSALFNARLGNFVEAASATWQAVQLDSLNEEIIIKVARAFAVLGKKEEMLKWFSRAKSMNPEYDEMYLAVDIDFKKFRNDPDLLSIARKKQ